MAFHPITPPPVLAGRSPRTIQGTYLQRECFTATCPPLLNLAVARSQTTQEISSVDSNANVFVSSRYTNTASFGSTVVTNSDSFLAKYDNAGNRIWAKPSLAVEAIAVGLSGSIYITGSALFSSATPGLLAKYDSLGNLVWSRQFPRGTSIAVDPDENTYTTGWGTGTYGDITITNGNYSHFFIARCDSSGQLKWFREAGNTSQQIGVSVAVDAFGNVYATATSASATREPVLTFGSTTLSNTFSFLAKYDAAGNELWA